MHDEYSVEELLDFLSQASMRGLLPVATAKALAVAVRNVTGVLDPDERADLRSLDLESVIRRFNDKRANDFNPSSLREYGQRTRRAVEYFLASKDDPAGLSIRRRATAKAKTETSQPDSIPSAQIAKTDAEPPISRIENGYQSAFPIRPGHIVTINNIPHDLSGAEADRLAQFIRLLAGG